MNGPAEQHPENDLPGDLKSLGGALDRRGAAQRGALSREALERIAAMSEMQLPMALPEGPVVVARIGTSRSPGRWLLRIAAAVAAAAVVGGAAWLLSGGGDEPTPGTLVQAGPTEQTQPSMDQALPLDASATAQLTAAITAEVFERVLATAAGARSASAVVVALSGSAADPAVHYHDVDDALAADIAPIFHSGSLLDGGGTTYDDLSGELAAIVASMPLR